MIKVLKPNNNKIYCTIKDPMEFEKVLKEIVEGISPTDIFLTSDNREMALNIFKRKLIEAIDDQINLNENEGYIIYITIGGEQLVFSCSYINNEKIGKGYTIALTLQD